MNNPEKLEILGTQEEKK